ncbi:hypothetical protein ABZ061_33080 [Streptomyces mutabilis]|uniref:hypothetical protein n=1 Tax=Streptomyces mutabilis TaxID=67332 RepID=UPI0033A5D0FB
MPPTPGHAYTSMNKNLTIGAYLPLARPIVPLLRLAMPVVYGHRAPLKATRSSVCLAASPEVPDTSGTYFNSKATACASKWVNSWRRHGEAGMEGRPSTHDRPRSHSGASTTTTTDPTAAPTSSPRTSGDR